VVIHCKRIYTTFCCRCQSFFQLTEMKSTRMQQI